MSGLRRLLPVLCRLLAGSTLLQVENKFPLLIFLMVFVNFDARALEGRRHAGDRSSTHGSRTEVRIRGRLARRRQHRLDHPDRSIRSGIRSRSGLRLELARLYIAGRRRPLPRHLARNRQAISPESVLRIDLTLSRNLSRQTWLIAARKSPIDRLPRKLLTPDLLTRDLLARVLLTWVLLARVLLTRDLARLSVLSIGGHQGDWRPVFGVIRIRRFRAGGRETV